MQRIAVVVAGLVVGVLAGAPQAQLSKRPIALDDLARLHTVGDPQVAPDGKWVAYTVETVDVEKDKRDTDLWMASWDGSEQIRLTATNDRGEHSPRWSPDNRSLAFLASRDDEQHRKEGSQVWLMNRAGGDAQQLTNITGGVSDFAWSPDSKHLALVVRDPDPNDEPEKKDGWTRKTAPPIVIDRYHFKRDRSSYLQDLHSHLSLLDVDARRVEPLTTGKFDDEMPSWSPDGRRIAFISNRSADPDRNENTQVYVVDATPGAGPRRVTTFEGTNTGRPSWSPDGKWIAYFQGEETKYLEYSQNRVAVVPAAGGEARIVTASLDRPASGNVVWSSDGRSLLFVVSDDRVSYVARVPAAGSGDNVERLATGRRVVSGLSPKGDGAFAVLSSTSTEAGEVFAFENGALRRITRQNDAVIGELALATADDFASKSKDGTEVHGIVVKPASYAAGRRYPMLLLIHGGPNGQDEHGFSFDRQFFAANGYVVIAVNYRGSSGRGAAYQKAIHADWGNKEVVDLLGAVDYMIASGVADPERLGIGGWSYGGILTDYTIATDQRFKAAVSGAGVANPIALYGIDQYILQYDNEIGPPWKTPEVWTKISYPFLHADRIKTPTLFLGGEKDSNVPLVGGEQMYQALKSLNVDTQLVIYPGQYHSITMPSYQRDRLSRYLAWFNKYLRPEAGSRPTAQR
jgi:dipeptidyl aminopeptidase/acylaminoacyl peptidase